MSRARQQKQHAMRRAFERDGVELTGDDYDSLCEQIREHRATFIFRESSSRTHFEVTHEEQLMVCVYHGGTQQIATFLPLEETAL